MSTLLDPLPSSELPVLAASPLLRDLHAGATLLLLLELELELFIAVAVAVAVAVVLVLVLVVVVGTSVCPSSRLDVVRFGPSLCFFVIFLHAPLCCFRLHNASSLLYYRLRQFLVRLSLRPLEQRHALGTPRCGSKRLRLQLLLVIFVHHYDFSS